MKVPEELKILGSKKSLNPFSPAPNIFVAHTFGMHACLTKCAVPQISLIIVQH